MISNPSARYMAGRVGVRVRLVLVQDVAKGGPFQILESIKMTEPNQDECVYQDKSCKNKKCSECDYADGYHQERAKGEKVTCPHCGVQTSKIMMHRHKPLCEAYLKTKEERKDAAR